MDLSKVYDCLPHDLIIAKFEAYGLSNSLQANPGKFQFMILGKLKKIKK